MRKKLFLMFLFVFTFSIGVSRIFSVCYSVEFYDDDKYPIDSGFVTDYHGPSSLDKNTFSNYYKCLKEKGKDVCDERISFIYADDFFCNQQSSSTNVPTSNYNGADVVSCGNDLLTDIPAMVPKTVHIIYLFLQIAVPVILVIFGTIDFIRTIISSKEDEIKKGQQTFIKRLISAVIIFFIFSIVKLVVSLVNGDSDRGINNVMNCTKCLINNDKNCVK